MAKGAPGATLFTPLNFDLAYVTHKLDERVLAHLHNLPIVSDPGSTGQAADDGSIQIAPKAVKRSIRPLALNRKNALFAGSDQLAAIASHVKTCKLNDIYPHVRPAGNMNYPGDEAGLPK